ESRLGNSEPSKAKSDTSLEEQLKETERDIILQKLSATDFNIETAAETLQLKPHDLRYRMHQLKLELDSD
ncbi:response regulator, partial [Verrucomicrobia bacterium]|nr:response regulator [Verrucomicrobiota bacterium]